LLAVVPVIVVAISLASSSKSGDRSGDIGFSCLALNSGEVAATEPYRRRAGSTGFP
jgi:hypothetical protein